MGKFRKLGRNYSQRLCMLRSRFLTRTNACILWLCVALPLISLDLSPRQDDGVAAGEARAHRDHRCQGIFFLSYAGVFHRPGACGGRPGFGLQEG